MAIKQLTPLMYQTRASVAAESGSAADLDGHSIVLFLVVDDFDAAEKAVAGAPVVQPRRRTFHGSTEIDVRVPGGHAVGFAQTG